MYLAREDCESLGGLLCRGESTGCPIGDVRFPASIGRLLGRDLTPAKCGRRPKRRTTGEQEAANAEY